MRLPKILVLIICFFRITTKVESLEHALEDSYKQIDQSEQRALAAERTAQESNLRAEMALSCLNSELSKRIPLQTRGHEDTIAEGDSPSARKSGAGLAGINPQDKVLMASLM